MYLDFIRVSFWRFILFLCFEHLCLILHFPWLSVFILAHLTKQTPLSLHGLGSHKRKPHPSAWPEILGLSSNSFPLQGEAGSCVFVCSLGAEQRGGIDGLHQFKLLFSPSWQDCTRFIRASRLERQNQPSGELLRKSWGAEHVNQPLLSPGRSWEPGGLLRIIQCWVRD